MQKGESKTLQIFRNMFQPFMHQFRQAKMDKKRFKSQLAFCLHSPLQLQVQKLDKS